MKSDEAEYAPVGCAVSAILSSRNADRRPPASGHPPDSHFSHLHFYTVRKITANSICCNDFSVNLFSEYASSLSIRRKSGENALNFNASDGHRNAACKDGKN